MAAYKLGQNDSIIRESDGATIPMVGGNRDYQEYMQWVADGNVADPADPIPVPEAVVTARQFRLALNALNLRSDVDAAVAAADQDTKDSWEYSTEIQRSHPMVAAIAAALNKTDEEVDAVFDLAKTK